MAQLIDKDAVVAEIKRLRERAYELYGYSQFDTAYNSVLESIDTLEVKGVDLEKEKDEEEKVLTYKHGFEDCKEQMMAKAFPVEIDSSRSDGRCILSGNFARFETGDKVKVIVIKQD